MTDDTHTHTHTRTHTHTHTHTHTQHSPSEQLRQLRVQDITPKDSAEDDAQEAQVPLQVSQQEDETTEAKETYYRGKKDLLQTDEHATQQPPVSQQEVGQQDQTDASRVYV